MKAAFIKNHGGIEAIDVGDLNIPKIRPDQVIIETKFAGLNHLDLFVIKGWPGLNLRMPHIFGADGSGIIKEIGSQVSTLEVGDKVTINPGTSCGKCKMCLSGKQSLCKKFSIMGETEWGTFAEFFKIPESNILKLPENYPLSKAAAAPLTFLTAYRMLVTKANIMPGKYIFIHGAGGGVAAAAIQIAKYFGGIVITTTSTDEKMEKAKELGADYVINYKEVKNYTKYVYEELTNKNGIDIVIDSVGQATLPTSVRLLRPGGQLITCGATSGPLSNINLTHIYWKQLEIKGSTMANHSEFHDVMNLVFKNRLNPIIDRIFPLDEIREAEKYLNEGKQFGKVLLKIS